MELKAKHIVDVYDDYAEHPFIECSQVYRKSEVDKVIAELEESHKMEVEQLLMEIVKLKGTIAQLEDDVTFWRSDARRHYSKGRLHDRYKRCLAMAKLCNEKWLVHNFEEIPTKLRFYDKWEKRWLALADKFKEAK